MGKVHEAPEIVDGEYQVIEPKKIERAIAGDGRIRVYTSDPGKYYAVRRGREIGIVRSWEECERRVHRFRGTAGEVRIRSSLSSGESQTPSCTPSVRDLYSDSVEERDMVS
ncbi:hypothetical protein M758_UG144700 [Ceratodon purpureus]|nr:hypothetical protein M758_UG144700 [Ceratodon purpureus]